MREITLRVERREAPRHPAAADALLVLRAPRLSPVPLVLQVVDVSPRGLGVQVPTGSLLVGPGLELDGLYATTASGQAWVGRAVVSRADIVPGPRGPWLHLGLALDVPGEDLGILLADDREDAQGRDRWRYL